MIEPQERTEKRSFDFTVRATCIAALALIACAFRLFFPFERMLKFVPQWQRLAFLPVWANWLIGALAVGALLWLLIRPRNRIAAAAVFAIVTLMVLQDVDRFSSGLWMYGFIMIVIVVGQGGTQKGMQAVRLMFGGAFIWSGTHKCTPIFYRDVLPVLMQPYHSFTEPTGVLDIVFMTLMYSFAPLQILIGGLLFVPRGRKLACQLCIISIVQLFFLFGPLQRVDYLAMWPWYIWLYAVTLRLFGEAQTNRRSQFLLYDMEGLSVVAFILYIIAPLNAFFAPWYALPGFKYASGDQAYAILAFQSEESFTGVPNDVLQKLVPRIYPSTVPQWVKAEFYSPLYPRPDLHLSYPDPACQTPRDPNRVTQRMFYVSAFRHSNDKTWHFLRLNELADNEFNMPLFPTRFTYAVASLGMCRYLDHPGTARMDYYSASRLMHHMRAADTYPLCRWKGRSDPVKKWRRMIPYK